MRAIIIDEPWTTHILEGRKRLEFRTRRTRIRERIGIIRKGSGLIVASAMLSDCVGPRSCEIFAAMPDHTSSREGLEAYARGRDLYAWAISDVRILDPPVPYIHPRGAQG